MEVLAAAAFPGNEPSLRSSTRSLALMLPRTLPRTTTSRAMMLAATAPLRPTVTRLPGRLIAPSTLPSMKSDSDPETSPLTTRDLPMVACSPDATAGEDAPPAAARAGPGSEAVGVEAGGAGRAGSGVEGEVGPVWFGFHIISVVSFPGCLK